VERYGTAGQATDEHITRRTHIACWTNKATDTNAEYVILIAAATATATIVRRTRPNITFLRKLPAFLRNYHLNLSGLYVYHVLHDSLSMHIYHHIFVLNTACSALKFHYKRFLRQKLKISEKGDGSCALYFIVRRSLCIKLQAHNVKMFAECQSGKEGRVCSLPEVDPTVSKFARDNTKAMRDFRLPPGVKEISALLECYVVLVVTYRRFGISVPSSKAKQSKVGCPESSVNNY